MESSSAISFRPLGFFITSFSLSFDAATVELMERLPGSNLVSFLFRRLLVGPWPSPVERTVLFISHPRLEQVFVGDLSLAHNGCGRHNGNLQWTDPDVIGKPSPFYFLDLPRSATLEPDCSEYLRRWVGRPRDVLLIRRKTQTTSGPGRCPRFPGWRGDRRTVRPVTTEVLSLGGQEGHTQ